METTRPLHDLFEELAGSGEVAQPDQVLRAGGHEDLPDGLVTEAVVNYADTAPFEVADHLSAFVRAHSPVPSLDVAAAEPPNWAHALSTVPVDIDPAAGLDTLGTDADSGPADLAGTARAGSDDNEADDVGVHDVGVHDVGVHDVGVHDVAMQGIEVHDPGFGQGDASGAATAEGEPDWEADSPAADLPEHPPLEEAEPPPGAGDTAAEAGPEELDGLDTDPGGLDGLDGLDGA